MPTLPLFDHSVTAGNGHDVRSPGGYEVWRFVARDPQTQTWINVQFHLGFVCHEYLARYQRYRRWPTHFAPPQPADYPAIRVQICANGRMHARICRARFDRLRNDALTVDALGIRLQFQPRSRQPFREIPMPFPQGTHRWIIADGLCDVSGTVDVDEKRVPFAGAGFHDQRFGTAPLLHETFSGFVLLPDEFIAFQEMKTMTLVRIGSQSLQTETLAASALPRSRTAWGLSYPRSLELGEKVRLNSPVVIDSTPLDAHFIYRSESGAKQIEALCSVDARHRTGWPILGKVFEASRGGWTS